MATASEWACSVFDEAGAWVGALGGLMTERPLHVRVAESLGWTGVFQSLGSWFGLPPPWRGPREHHPETGIPRYDTDWAATGPLIEKYGITLEFFNDPLPWWAKCHGIPPRYPQKVAPQGGKTPLIAVCELFLKLEEK